MEAWVDHRVKICNISDRRGIRAEFARNSTAHPQQSAPLYSLTSPAKRRFGGCMEECLFASRQQGEAEKMTCYVICVDQLPVALILHLVVHQWHPLHPPYWY